MSLCSSTYNIYSTFFPQLESTKNNEYNNSLKNVWLLELFRSKKSTKVAACIREVAATFVVKTRQLSKKSPQESYRLGVNLTTLWNDLKFCFLKKKNRPHIILGQEISKRNWKIPATYFPKICIFQWKSESDYIYPRLLGMTTTGVDTIKNAQLDHITQVAPWRDTQERLLNSCIHQKSVVFQEIYYLADLKNQILKMEN